MVSIRDSVLNILEKVTILFLGLNIAWMELTFNMKGGPDLGWPVLDMLWYSPTEWFWIHLVLTILSVAFLLIIYQTKISHLKAQLRGVNQ